MISSASLLLLLLGTGTADTTAPVAVARQVRAALAERWQMPDSAVVLSWGQWPADTARFASARMRFAAAPDREGWLVVNVTPDSGSPASVRLRAGVRAPAPVATRDLAIGHLLVAEDLTVAERIRWGGPDQGATANAIGWEVRRPLSSGDPLTAAAIAAPMGARAGEPVRFVWQRGLVQIEIEAVALASARIGETIRGRKGELRYAGILTAPGIARLEGKIP